jgi:HK97 family phage major capsid protein
VDRDRRRELTDLREDRADTMQKIETLANAPGGRDGKEGLFNRLEARAYAITEKIEALEAEIGLKPKGNRSLVVGPNVTGLRAGDGSGEARGTGHGGDLRSQAINAIERMNTMPDDARQAFTVTLEHDDDPESKMARWTLAAGAPDYRAAFRKWLRDPMNGHREWTDAELAAYQRVQHEARVLGLGSQGGGLMTPIEVDPQILIAGVGSVDPMRQIARVTQSAENVKQFVTTLGASASWDPESQEVSDDSPTLLGPQVTCYKGQVYVPVSWELAGDTDIQDQVGNVLLDAKAQLEATAFTTGTGTAQPKGVITAVSAVGGSVIATGTNVLAQADLYANQAALPARWRANARWAMNLSIINGYRQLPQATALNYSIINDDGPIPRALGWEISENSTMDGVLGAGTDYTVLSGDFQQYAIVDRVGAELSFVPHTFGAAGRPKSEVGFLLRWRTGGDVLIPDAFRLTNHST